MTGQPTASNTTSYCIELLPQFLSVFEESLEKDSLEKAQVGLSVIQGGGAFRWAMIPPHRLSSGVLFVISLLALDKT